MEGWILGAFFGGLLGSPHCVGMCGGFAAAASDQPVAWHLGRLLTYTTLGALAGFFGVILPGPPWVSAVVSVVLLGWFSLRLAGLAPEFHMPALPLARAGAAFARRPGFAGRFGLGVVTSLLPCGLLWSALGLAVGSNHPGAGALAMALFWLGTVPLLVGATAGLKKFIDGSRRRRIALAGLVFAAGLWSVAQRTPSADAAEDSAPPCHAEE